jgi:hypothetical protein
MCELFIETANLKEAIDEKNASACSESTIKVRNVYSGYEVCSYKPLMRSNTSINKIEEQERCSARNKSGCSARTRAGETE